MKFLKKMAVIFLAVLEVLTSSGLAQAAEAPAAVMTAVEENVHLHDDNSDGKAYLRIIIGVRNEKNEIEPLVPNKGLFYVTDYSSYSVQAIYYDEKNKEKPLDESKVNWHGVQITSSRGEEAAINNGILWTGAVTGEVSIWATYEPPGEEPLESPRYKIKVQNLNLDPTQKETLQCAALCLAVGTYFNADDIANDGKSIGELLKKSPNYLNQQGDYISKKQQTGATFASFYSATISDWKLVDYKKGKGGFYAALFKAPSGNCVLSYRGTQATDLGDDWNDLMLGTGHKSTQLKEGVAYYKELKSQKNHNITMLTGHSLGGGIANYVSDVQNVRAITFNAPSTMVSAINNETIDFARCYMGLNYARRTDYVNSKDWVGNAGVGDNTESTRLFQGQKGELANLIKSLFNKATKRKGGLIDRTVFVDDQSTKNGRGILAYHSFEQLLQYDVSNGKISFKEQGKSFCTNTQEFTYLGSSYFLGTDNSGKDDKIETINFTYIKGDGYVFGGNGRDSIRLNKKLFKESWDVFIVCGGRGNDTITLLFTGWGNRAW